MGYLITYKQGGYNVIILCMYTVQLYGSYCANPSYISNITGAAKKLKKEYSLV